MSEIAGRYQVSLCRGRSCCPQLIIENDQYIITDDFGGKVVLEKEHIEELIGQWILLEIKEETEEDVEKIDPISQFRSGARYLVRSNVNWGSLPQG